MADKYLAEFNKIVGYNESKKAINASKLKQGYRSGIRQMSGRPYEKPIKGDYVEFIPQYQIARDKVLGNTQKYSNRSSDEDRGYAMSVANRLMRTERSMDSTLKGAMIYEQLGQGNRGSIKRKLLRKFKKFAEKKPQYISEYSGAVKEFLERNSPGARKEVAGKLERTAMATSIAGFFGGLFFLSPNLTGNVIANMSVQNSSFLGAGLLIVGLVAGVLALKNRK